MDNNIGITNTGYNSPTYEEILEKVMDAFKSSIGKDLVMTSNSVAGILAREIAWRLSFDSDNLEKVYYSGFVSRATDIALDRLGNNFGLTRKVATNSFVELTFRTKDEYLIQAGEQFETENGIVFDLINDVLTVKDPSVPQTKTDDNDSENDETEVGNFIGKGIAMSDEKGEMNNVPSGAVTIVFDPNDDIVSVTNEKPASGGQDTETDESFRNRIIMENSAKPGSTENGIKSALYNLDGVRQVSIVYNKTSVTDADGNPPYSVHIYILGGKGQEIAQTLYDNIAAGSNLTGDETYYVKDINGLSTPIKFSFAKEAPIYIRVKIKTNETWSDAIDLNALKQNLVDSISELKMGNKIYSTKLYTSVYGFDGIEEAIVGAGTSKDNITDNSDVILGRFEFPSIITENISIEKM